MTATAPPGYVPAYGFGGSTAPSKHQLVSAAHVILANCGIAFGTRKILRLVDRFTRSAPNGSGYAFFLYLTNAVQMSAQQQRDALLAPDVARVVSYNDPTGETAVRNVMREAGR